MVVATQNFAKTRKATNKLIKCPKEIGGPRKKLIPISGLYSDINR
jgi:hypothetical protein